MAIRTLGEKKDRRALPVLRELVGSKDFFTADYARAAVAAIEGKPYRRPASTAEQCEADVKFLPAGTGLVFQRRIALGKAGPMDRVLTPKRPASVPTGGLPQALGKALVEHLVHLAEQVGNFRVQTTTTALSARMGGEGGFLVTVARGHFNTKALKELLRKMNATAVKVGTAEALQLGYSGMVLMPLSDRRVVVISSPSADALPIDALAKAVAGGEGGMGKDEKVATLVKAADHAKGIWAVAKMTETYRQVEFLAPFQQARFEAERKADGIHLWFTATGTDAAAVKQAMALFEEQVKELRKGLGEQARSNPLLKVYLPVLDAVKVQVDGTRATITAKVPPEVDLESPTFVLIVGPAVGAEMSPHERVRIEEQIVPAPAGE
jgi:hypothetical protein